MYNLELIEKKLGDLEKEIEDLINDSHINDTNVNAQTEHKEFRTNSRINVKEVRFNELSKTINFELFIETPVYSLIHFVRYSLTRHAFIEENNPWFERSFLEWLKNEYAQTIRAGEGELKKNEVLSKWQSLKDKVETFFKKSGKTQLDDEFEEFE